MRRGAARAWLAVVAGCGVGCSLFTDLGGFDEGEGVTTQPTPDAGADAPGAEDAPGDAEVDAGGYRPRYQGRFSITNNASVAMPASFPVCAYGLKALDLVTAGKLRADFGDLRIFGATGERRRVIDVRAGGVTVTCFRTDRPIAPGGKDEGYVVRYGDPNMAPPPPAEVDVFTFWDGFDGTSLSAKWLTFGAPKVAGGVLTLPAGEHGVTTVAALDGVPLAASLELRVKVADPDSDPVPRDGGTFYYWFGFQHKGDFEASQPWSIFVARGKGQIHAEHKTVSGSCEPGCGDVYYPQRTDFRVYRIDRTEAAVGFLYDDGKAWIAEGSNGDESIMIRNWLAASELQVDWVRARPIVEPAPTISAAEEEVLY